jgi:carboxypeptidase C (cathepsin A)
LTPFRIGSPPAGSNADAAKPTPAETTKPADPTDDLVERKHTLTVGRRKLAYTSLTGRIVLREEILEDGKAAGFKAKATVFITAYTLDGADRRKRPVTFAFNGGPGSSSVWLHLGLLGPRRVVAGDAGAPVPPPYDLVDNVETLSPTRTSSSSTRSRRGSRGRWTA